MLKKWFNLKWISLIFGLSLVLAFFAFADDVVTPPSGDEITAFLKALGGITNLGALGIVALVIQGLMLVFRTPLTAFAGVWQLVIVSGLSLVFGVITQISQGVNIWVALMNSATLAAAQVFIHQIVTQVKKAPTDVKPAV